MKRHPWVFWFRITIRKKWFSYWWKTRGANFMDIQVWIFAISIGMPWRWWKPENKDSNEANAKQRFSIYFR